MPHKNIDKIKHQKLFAKYPQDLLGNITIVEFMKIPFDILLVNYQTGKSPTFIE